MSINIWTDSMQHAALLGKPVLFTNWLIQRDIIPDGWYCYDLRGTHKSPSTRTTLVDHAADYHAGTVLSPIPLKHEGTASRRVNGTFYLLGEEMTLEQFCEEHDLAYPQDNREFVLRPASLDEVGLFYSEEKLDEALGTVGHLRMDFGHGEKEFWHTWWPHNEDRFNTPEFKEVLQRFVDDLRQTGLLKNLGAMDAYCWQHGGSITEDRRSYGYIAETENYRFCLRCTPFPGEYQGYLYAQRVKQLSADEIYRHSAETAAKESLLSALIHDSYELDDDDLDLILKPKNPVEALYQFLTSDKTDLSSESSISSILSEYNAQCQERDLTLGEEVTMC